MVVIVFADINLNDGHSMKDAIIQDSNAVPKLLTHIPDIVINYNQNVPMPAKKECIGVAMFADISGAYSSSILPFFLSVIER